MQGSTEQKLILPLVILICQVRDTIEILPDAVDIKFISQQYDLCQQSLLQVSTHKCQIDLQSLAFIAFTLHALYL